MNTAAILYGVVLFVMALGVIGSFIPALPGISLVAVAIAVWGFQVGFANILLPLTVAIVMLLVSIGIDFFAGYLGAKQAGASKWGQIGAAIGLVIGVLGLLPALPFGGPFLGLLVGPLVGALIGEYLHCRSLDRASKAALGIVVGSLVGIVIQGVLAIAAVIVFLMTTWPYQVPWVS